MKSEYMVKALFGKQPVDHHSNAQGTAYNLVSPEKGGNLFGPRFRLC